MAVLVISGSGRGAGKTAVGCALIQAMPELRWVAVKVTPHGHDQAGALKEEEDFESPKDTGRYLRAGAANSYLVSTPQASSSTEEALGGISRRNPTASAWLVESGAIEPGILSEIAGPVISLAVLSGDPAEWKPSLPSHLTSIDALVLAGGLSMDRLSPQFRAKLGFRLPECEWVTPELLAFVRDRLLI